MVVRYIDPDKIYDIDVNGTIFKVKQIFPQSNIFLLNSHRMKVAAKGEEEDYKAIRDIMLKYVVEIDNQPEGWDVAKSLKYLDTNDMTKLLTLMQEKSTFSEAEEKN